MEGFYSLGRNGMIAIALLLLAPVQEGAEVGAMIAGAVPSSSTIRSIAPAARCTSPHISLRPAAAAAANIA